LVVSEGSLFHNLPQHGSTPASLVDGSRFDLGCLRPLALWPDLPVYLASSSERHSAVTNGDNNPVVTYTDENGLVKTKTYSGGSWSAATTIQSSGVSSAPVLSSVESTNKLYALWFRNGALEYKYFDGATWDASPTILESSTSASRFAGCDLMSGGGIIKCMMLTGSSAPFTLKSGVISPP
jgi:hypothetical protein